MVVDDGFFDDILECLFGINIGEVLFKYCWLLGLGLACVRNEGICNV